MSNDKEIQRLIEKLLAGEISQSESDQLEDYVAKYPEYKEMMAVHQKLNSVEFPAPDPETALFSQMRIDVLRKIRVKEQESPGLFQELFDKIKDYAFRPEMAIAALTLIIGFLLGRALPPDQGTLTSNLMAKIRSLAIENTNLEDVQRSPVIYSNVQLEDIDDGLVSINLDATTHLDFTGKKDDPLVRDIMAQTLLSSSNVGSELKAISYTKGMVDPKIKEALILSLHNRPNLATRLKVIRELIDYKDDKVIEDAFLKVLHKEESVRMRLLAIDYLVDAHVDPDTLEQVMIDSEVTMSPAVMIKMKNYIEKN